MQLKSIRLKTTLLYSGILFLILIIYNIVFFFSVRTIMIKDIDEELEVKAQEIANILRAYEKIKSVSSQPLGILESLLQKHGMLQSRAVIIDDLWRSEFKTLRLEKDYINILNANGKAVIDSSNVTRKIRGIVAEQFGFSIQKPYFGNISSEGLRLRAINLPFLYKSNLPLAIQVVTSLDSIYKFLAKLMINGSIGIILIVVLTSFLGSFFVKDILRPVVTVTKAANDISHKDLGKRISLQGVDTEMKHLVDSFNGMLERLQKSFIHVNEFNSYVAHELKTPLAIVRGELEMAIEQAHEEREDKKILSECLEEVDRMIKITKDLLLLAKLDYDTQVFKFRKIDFGEFFQEINEHARMLVSEKNIKLLFDYPKQKLFISADNVHLRRLFLNIITNAIKYTPREGTIKLSAERVKDVLHIDIADTGIGISKENLPKIFDKFFRIDKGEKMQEGNFGLGLSIALSIAKAHQGDIKVKSIVGQGTTFTVILPLDL